MLEHAVAHNFHHLVRAKVAVVAEAELLLLRRKAWFKINACDLLTLLVPLFLGIQHPRVHQVGDLFDNGQRVCDTTYPEIFPQPVDFTF